MHLRRNLGLEQAPFVYMYRIKNIMAYIDSLEQTCKYMNTIKSSLKHGYCAC